MERSSHEPISLAGIRQSSVCSPVAGAVPMHETLMMMAIKCRAGAFRPPPPLSHLGSTKTRRQLQITHQLDEQRFEE